MQHYYLFWSQNLLNCEVKAVFKMCGSQGQVFRHENSKYCDDIERVTSCSTRTLAHSAGLDLEHQLYHRQTNSTF